MPPASYTISPHSGSTGRLWRRGIVSTATFMAALVVSGWLVCFAASIDQALEGESALQRPYRLDDVDIVFAGSSTVGNMVNPNAFDEEMRREGHGVHSYNIARGGCGPHETAYLVRFLLRSHPKRLKYVVVGCEEFSPEFLSKATGTARLDGWHDLEQTRIALIGADSEAAREHLKAMARHYLSIGKYKNIANLFWVKSIGSENGYRPFAQIEAVSPKNRHDLEILVAAFAADRAYERRVAERINWFGEERKPTELTAQTVAGIKSLLRASEKGGVTLIYLAPPSFWHTPAFPRAVKASGIAPVLLIDDPTEYPQFYARKARYDALHLNDEASIEFSREVARQFLRQIEFRESANASPS